MGHPTVNLSPKDSMTALIATRRQRRRCVSCVEWLYPTSADDSILPSSVELASHTFIVSQNRPFGSGVFSRLATSPERRLDTRRVAYGTKLEKHETVCGAIQKSVTGVRSARVAVAPLATTSCCLHQTRLLVNARNHKMNKLKLRSMCPVATGSVQSTGVCRWQGRCLG